MEKNRIVMQLFDKEVLEGFAGLCLVAVGSFTIDTAWIGAFTIIGGVMLWGLKAYHILIQIRNERNNSKKNKED